MEKTGLQIIEQERDEQINKHGYSLEHAKSNMHWYSHQELLQAANFCVSGVEEDWPVNWNDEARDKISGKSRIGQLACAGAFFMAQADLFGMNDYLQRNIEWCAVEIDIIQNQEGL